MTTTTVAVVAGLAGLAVGSFLDVVAFRLPRGLSLLQPPSFCPACDRRLAWFDNLPVASWLVLRGRCRRCGATIPARALLVEAGTAAGFVGVALAAPSLAGVAGCCLALATVVALAATAADGQPLPPAVSPVGTALAGAALAVAGAWAGWGHLVDAAAGVAAAGLAAVVVAVAARRGRHPEGPNAGTPEVAAAAAGVADGMGAALPTGALLGWLGAVPAGAGAGAAVAVALAMAALGARRRAARREHGGVADGSLDGRAASAQGRRAVAVAALAAAGVALVVAGTA